MSTLAFPSVTMKDVDWGHADAAAAGTSHVLLTATCSRLSASAPLWQLLAPSEDQDTSEASSVS